MHDRLRDLELAVQHVAHFLPAQGPISVFVHHNPLHAFEHMSFEHAVVEAARLNGCEPFLSEADYREALRRGRISDADIDAALRGESSTDADPTVAAGITRSKLRRHLLVQGIPERRGHALAWSLTEGAVAAHEPLWAACLRATDRAPHRPLAPTSARPRHRDLLLAVTGTDIDEAVHPVLIRVVGAFLDQGLADWTLPGREQGLLAAFVDLYRRPAGRLARPFGTELVRLLGQEPANEDPLHSLAHSLEALGTPPAQWEACLLAEALALPGFAGMVHQFEVRPDRVPAVAVPARLVDFLAVRMLLVRAALEHAARDAGFGGELAGLRPWLEARSPGPATTTRNERAFELFHVAQVCGLDAEAVDHLTDVEVAAIADELRAFDSVTRRRLWHRAYERRLRHRFFDALVEHRSVAAPPPACQAIFCIDEREESIRRHVEEIDPEVETFGAAGYFGVAMYYQGDKDAHPRPLCPVAVQPRHYVPELRETAPKAASAQAHRQLSRLDALLAQSIHLGGRRAGRGAVLTATLGILWAVPLVLHVMFPWLRRGIGSATRIIDRRPPGRLMLEHEGDAPDPAVAGAQTGFTVAEMADVVEGLLAPMGIADRFAPLVLVVGHGSSSLNNPHESAHDCGACGGGRGGPNARAFAQMANDPRVRALVAERGLGIPPRTWFVGAQRNTASNDLELYDEDRVPAHLRDALERYRGVLDEARRREAHERCRRFESAPLWLPSLAALFHVQARATDIAQPRPEYGHASNAVCMIGRRARTRGLFLDRRAFLVSYDPSSDPEGARLERLLAAVVPVVAGINLEYLFGYTDPVGYGCGTKLPHNVTGLVGVMDGAQSDLRTGLPWQMLEIHEPVRLSIAVEARVDVLMGTLARNEQLRSLVRNGWIFLAALDPDSDALHEIGADGASRYRPEHGLVTTRGTSRDHYAGHREHLAFVAIDPDPEASR